MGLFFRENTPIILTYKVLKFAESVLLTSPSCDFHLKQRYTPWFLLQADGKICVEILDNFYWAVNYWHLNY